MVRLIINSIYLLLTGISLLFISANLFFARRKVAPNVPVIVYRWIALLALGLSNVYAGVVHATYPYFSPANLVYPSGEVHYEIAIAEIIFGMVCMLAFKASFGYRLAVAICSALWLWTDTCMHLFQLIRMQNGVVLNLTVEMWLNFLLPLILLICISLLKPE